MKLLIGCTAARNGLQRRSGKTVRKKAAYLRQAEKEAEDLLTGEALHGGSIMIASSDPGTITRLPEATITKPDTADMVWIQPPHLIKALEEAVQPL